MGYCAGCPFCVLLHGIVFRRHGEWRTWSHRCTGDRSHRCTCRGRGVGVVAHAARLARVAVPETCRWCPTRREWAVQICAPPDVFGDRALHARRWACLRESCGVAHVVCLSRLLHGQDRSRGGDARGNRFRLSRVQIRCCLEVDPFCHIGEVLMGGQLSEKQLWN